MRSEPSSPLSMFQIRVLGGAMAAVGSSATAFAHRRAPVMVAALALFEDVATAPVHEAWADALLAELAGRVPGRGELVQHGSGIAFEVLDADPRSVKRVRVRNAPPLRPDAPQV